MIVYAEIDGYEYTIVCDDEGLLKQDASPTLYLNDDCVIFGSLLFMKDGDEGEAIGLDEEDCDRVIRFIQGTETKMRNWQIRTAIRLAKEG